MMQDYIIQTDGVVKTFDKGKIIALDDVSFTLKKRRYGSTCRT